MVQRLLTKSHTKKPKEEVWLLEMITRITKGTGEDMEIKSDGFAKTGGIIMEPHNTNGTERIRAGNDSVRKNA